MKKKILIFAIILILIVAGGAYYANTFLLPTVVRNKIISGLSAATGTRVSLKKISVNLLRGIVIEELVIADLSDANKQLLRIQRGSISLMLIPLLMEKKIITEEEGIRLMSL